MDDLDFVAIAPLQPLHGDLGSLILVVGFKDHHYFVRRHVYSSCWDRLSVATLVRMTDIVGDIRAR